jgi:hypothetical protein
MHPSRMEIRSLLEGTLADTGAQSILSAHLQQCEFCADIADEERMILEELQKTSTEAISPELQKLGSRWYQASLLGVLVDLTPLTTARDAAGLRIAADTSGPKTPRIESLLTLFSEKPEFVLNVMRDNSAHKDYLQLSSDEPENVSQVLVRIPQLDTELLTDPQGRVELPEQLTSDAATLNWQVKLPSAIFDLEPIVYDPDEVEFSQEIELASDKHDRIQVTFQRKTEGAQVIIRVLELDGQTDFKHVRVALSQENALSHIETAPDKPVTFDILDKDRAIHIRLFN